MPPLIRPEDKGPNPPRKPPEKGPMEIERDRKIALDRQLSLIADRLIEMYRENTKKTGENKGTVIIDHIPLIKAEAQEQLAAIIARRTGEPIDRIGVIIGIKDYLRDYHPCATLYLKH